MVHFFCNNCGDYLKKKQAEQHVHICSDSVSCNQCKVTLQGFDAIKRHTSCGANGTKKISKQSTIKTLSVDGIEWNGFKNTLRRIVKKAERRMVNREHLKNLLKKVMEREGESLDKFDKLFLLKLNRAKNLKINGNVVKYSQA